MRKRLEGMEEVELTFMWHAESAPFMEKSLAYKEASYGSKAFAIHMLKLSQLDKSILPYPPLCSLPPGLPWRDMSGAKTTNLQTSKHNRVQITSWGVAWHLL